MIYYWALQSNVYEVQYYSLISWLRILDRYTTNIYHKYISFWKCAVFDQLVRVSGDMCLILLWCNRQIDVDAVQIGDKISNMISIIFMSWAGNIFLALTSKTFNSFDIRTLSRSNISVMDTRDSSHHPYVLIRFVM